MTLHTAGHTAGRVDVVGSIALDTQFSVDHPPGPGEIVVASQTVTGMGGKGANQAVAVARSGVDVRLVGSIGDDVAGDLVMEELASFGVDTELISIHTEERTGHGYTFVAADRSVRTVVVRGANLRTDVEAVRDVADRLATAAVILLQGEVGRETIEETLRLASQWPSRVVLNPAPVVEIDPDLYPYLDVLVVNESEAAALCGAEVTHDVGDIEDMAVELAKRGPSVVVSVGAGGAVVVPSHRPVEFVMAQSTQVVDPAGAGDAFVGVLAAGIARGLGVQEATAAAVRQATRTVARRGAVRSYPTFDFH